MELYCSDSDDPDGTWELAGTINWSTGDGAKLTFNSPYTTKRYFTGIATTSNRDPFSSIAEFVFIGH